MSKSHDTIDVFKSLVGDDIYKQVKDLYNKMSSSHEFEFMFYNYNKKLMSYEKFLNVMKYLKQKHLKQKLSLVTVDTLDIVYNERNITDEINDIKDPNIDDVEKENPYNITSKSYRITIEGMENINKYMKMLHRKRNHVILNVLASLIIDGDKNLISLLKTKDSENLIDINDLIMRVRLSEEKPMSKAELKKLNELHRDEILNVSFRLKQRVSLYVLGDPISDDFVKIDLTITNTTKDINKIEYAIPRYELEIECGTKSKSKPKPEMLDKMLSESLILIKLMQQSNHIITETVANNVINEYKNILSLSGETITSLDARQSFSLEIQHLTEVLPNKYAVTDKADGDRTALIITNNHVYFISTNLVVRDTGIELSKNNEQFNGTILDGELLYLPKKNRHMYLTFDCLFNGKTDVRKMIKLMDRLKIADQIINECFVLGKQKNYKFKDFKSKKQEFDLNEILSFHRAQMYDYLNLLNHDIDDEKNYPLIRRKYFIDVTGAKSWELFAYSDLMFKLYTEDSKSNCPYLLDGLIYQPLEQEYITSVKDSKYVEYKWKPPNKNSVDFFIQFEKDKETNKVLTIFDNSIDEYIKNKPYKICNLHVGQRDKINPKGGEIPTLFRKEEGLYMAYLFLQNGEVRDLDGNILQDKTVVEFYYNNDPNVDDKFRWVPIRTRNDKTESVIRYRRKYGNYIDVANKVWRSIVNPILASDFEELAKGNLTYEKKITNMRSKISHELIVSAAKENAYYQLKTNLAKPMRQFHNWIKSIIIYTYCHPMYEHERSLSILDIACGRGGDLLKFYYAKCAFYVGLDIDKEGLVSAVDGAESRYAQMRKTHPNFPQCSFLQADAGALLTYDDQNRVFGGMSTNNANLMNKFFPKESEKKVKFDRINCQFAMHYFLKNEETWSNFKTNLNNHLKAGGYFLTTVFDADRVVELLKETDTYTINYTTPKGEKKILFELKRYQVYGEKPYKTGNAVDLHASWMFREGQYATEYLVDKDFLIKDLLNDCDLELVDTDLFDNQYEIHKDYFMNFAKYDDNPETQQFLLKVAGFYDHNEINGGCFKYTRLERYYIFRKKDNKDKNTKEKITVNKKSKQSRQKKQKGGEDNGKLDIKDILDDDTLIHRILGEDDKSDYTYFKSLHHVLQSQKMIPKNVSIDDFIADFGLDKLKEKDSELTNEKIRNINKNIVIEHDVEYDLEGKDIRIENVLDGLNALIIEKNCNDEYDLDIINNNNKIPTKTIVLYKQDNVYNPLYRLQRNNSKSITRGGNPDFEKIGLDKSRNNLDNNKEKPIKYVGLFDNSDKFIVKLISNMNID